jgi:dephospho-CoA kinase
MSLIYVTGAPGSGKSTIQNELTKLGYIAYDIDDARFGGPINLKTGQSTIVPPIDQRKPEWFNQHEWRISRTAIEDLKKDAKNKPVYLCGTATTDHLVWDLFDKVLYLNISEQTLKYRIANRKDNNFGKTKYELQLILRRHKQMVDNMKRLHATLIDAEQSLEKTVHDIVT